MFKFKRKKKRFGILTSWQAKLFYACIVILPILNFFVMYVGVNFNSFLLAFQRYDYDTSFKMKSTVYTWNGWTNIRQVWNDFMGKDSILGYAIKNSLIYYIVPTLFGITIGLWSSFYIAKKMRGAEFFMSFGVFFGTLSPFMMSLLWLHLTTTGYPVLVQMLTGEKVQGLYSNPDTIILATLLYPMITLGASLLNISLISRVPQSCIEAAELDGITPLKEFYYITLPLISPTIAMQLATGIPAIFIGQGGLFNYFGEFAPASAQTIGYILFVKVAGSKASVTEYPYAAAAGMLCTFVCVPLVLFARYLMKKLPDVSY